MGNLMIGSETHPELLGGEKRWEDFLELVSSWMDKYLDPSELPSIDSSGEEKREHHREYKKKILNDPEWISLFKNTTDKKLLAHAIAFNLLQKSAYEEGNSSALDAAQMFYSAVVGANGWKKSFCPDINIFEMSLIASICLVLWKVVEVPGC